MQTDSDFMLAVLQSHVDEWVSQREILTRSEQMRGCGLTPHSRASDLRNRGHIVENRTERRGTRVVSFYKLVSPLRDAGSVEPTSSPRGTSYGESGIPERGALARPVEVARDEAVNMGNAESEGTAPLTLFHESKRPAWH